MAIASAKQDPNNWKAGANSIVQYLKNNVASLSTCTDYSRFILSMVAARTDPETITKDGAGLVTKLKSFYDGSQFGDASLINDDYWAVMALISAGIYKSDQMIQNTLTFIKSKQNSDGGWSWAVGQSSDVDDTAAAIMALIAGGEPTTSTYVTAGLSYMKSQQTDSGGFGFMGCSSAETDSWAIQAIVAAGQDPTSSYWTKNGKTPVDDLLTFQDPGTGGFKDYTGNPNAWTTSYAIPALLGKPHPVVRGAKVNIRIEGQSSTVWKGEVFVSWSDIIDNQGQHHYYDKPTVLGALDEASKKAGFTYVVTYQWGPAYVTTIKGESASGVKGWLFRVNDHMTGSYSADQYVLNGVTPPPPPHTTVLWFYGEWNDKVARISVNATTVNAGQAFTATVTYLDESSETWLPVESASVHADTTYTTGSDGRVSISISTPGIYEVYAEKAGYVRTDRVQVIVAGGEGPNLKVTIIPALSITVTPSYIDFGEMGPGDTSSPYEIQVKNEGSLTGIVTVTVTDIGGSTVFHDCLQMSIGGDWRSWTEYQPQTLGEHGGARSEWIRMSIPATYQPVIGVKEGKITFWLQPA